jgi:hypothetical protein
MAPVSVFVLVRHPFERARGRTARPNFLARTVAIERRAESLRGSRSVE